MTLFDPLNLRFAQSSLAAWLIALNGLALRVARESIASLFIRAKSELARPSKRRGGKLRAALERISVANKSGGKAS